eukprot:m51a1_g5582 hypothetical protein (305) ;mRNA; f:630253-631420
MATMQDAPPDNSSSLSAGPQGPTLVLSFNTLTPDWRNTMEITLDSCWRVARGLTQAAIFMAGKSSRVLRLSTKEPLVCSECGQVVVVTPKTVSTGPAPEPSRSRGPVERYSFAVRRVCRCAGLCAQGKDGEFLLLSVALGSSSTTWPFKLALCRSQRAKRGAPPVDAGPAEPPRSRPRLVGPGPELGALVVRPPEAQAPHGPPRMRVVIRIFVARILAPGDVDEVFARGNALTGMAKSLISGFVGTGTGILPHMPWEKPHPPIAVLIGIFNSTDAYYASELLLARLAPLMPPVQLLWSTAIGLT